MAKLISADLTNNKLCIIKYTTTNRKILGFFPNSFDAKILSNTYHINGEIIFEKPITKLCGLLSISNKDLTSILIPDSVESIDDRVFYICFSLISITLSNSLTTIGKSAFRACGITSITIPNSVMDIEECAFESCFKLSEFKGKFSSQDGRCLIIDGVLNSFAPAKLHKYTIPNDVSTIGYRAFSKCPIHNITIGNNVTTIGNSAFNECKELETVTIHNGVKTIGAESFVGCI